MKTLHLLPTPYRNQSIVKTAFAFDKVIACCLITLGKSLKHIQTLLGNGSSKTTEIYTHVTKKGFENLKSTFDALEFEKSKLRVV